jgi:CubicO group peptidase (beta-lactamase class C family)
MISSPEAENMDREKLEQAYRLVYRDDRYLTAKSLLVFRNGKLVAEAYPADENDMDNICNIQSMTKSVTSVLIGIAVQNGVIGDLDEKLFDIFPDDFDSDTSKRNITIRNALTMQTGLRFDNDQDTQEFYRAKKSVNYVLSRPKEHEAGTVVNYNDGAPQLISKVIEAKTGISLEEYAKSKLFKHLDIKDWLWESAKDGTTFGAFSLFLKPRDIGKIGQMMSESGRWLNTQLVDMDYLRRATTTQATDEIHDKTYGYYFHTVPGENACYAFGQGGQFMFAAPEKSLVIVYTAWPYTSSKFFDDNMELIRMITESCE